MKKIIYSCIILLLALHAGAQKLSRLEYFYDADPGTGKAKAITFTAADTINNTFSFSVAGLAPGLHTLYTRFQNDTRQWGSWTAALIFVDKYYDMPGLKTMEYFFDTDPGTNKATAINVSGVTSVITTQLFTAKSVKEGTHILYLRYKDSANHYGPVSAWPVNINVNAADMPQLSGAEYFFDTDPRTGKASKITIARTDISTATQAVNVGNLTDGLHILYMRFRDTAGRFGHTASGLFYVTDFDGNMPAIAGAEYFVDTDPGVGKGKPIAISPQADTIKKTLALAVPSGLTTGKKHYLHLRVKDTKNNWSLVKVDSFVVTATAAASIQLIARQDADHVNLTWQPEMQDESSVYIIEKGNNSISFKTLSPKNNSSNRMQSGSFDFIDDSPDEGVNYYRIKQTDASGNVTFSNIEAVWINRKKNKAGMQLYPNPASTYVTITRDVVANEKATWVTVSDLKGHILIKENSTNKTIQTLQLGKLAKGIYFVSVVTENKVQTEKLVVQ